MSKGNGKGSSSFKMRVLPPSPLVQATLLVGDTHVLPLSLWSACQSSINTPRPAFQQPAQHFLRCLPCQTMMYTKLKDCLACSSSAPTETERAFSSHSCPHNTHHCYTALQFPTLWRGSKVLVFVCLFYGRKSPFIFLMQKDHQVRVFQINPIWDSESYESVVFHQQGKFSYFLLNCYFSAYSLWSSNLHCSFSSWFPSLFCCCYYLFVLRQDLAM